MKKRIFFLTLFFLLMLCQAQAQSAPVAPGVGCIDRDIVLRVDEVKHFYAERGYKIFRDAMVSMESEEPYSIEVKLDKGHKYQLVYMGSDISTRSSMEVYDGENRAIIEKVLSRNEPPGYITVELVPVKTDIYLIVLQQKQRHASMCGSFTILEGK